MKRQTKPYWEMNTSELREATREFDREELGIPGKPLTAYDRKLHAQVRRKARLKEESIRVRLESDLLKKADAAAKKRNLSRSEWIAATIRDRLKRAS